MTRQDAERTVSDDQIDRAAASLVKTAVSADFSARVLADIGSTRVRRRLAWRGAGVAVGVVCVAWMGLWLVRQTGEVRTHDMRRSSVDAGLPQPPESLKHGRDDRGVAPQFDTTDGRNRTGTPGALQAAAPEADGATRQFTSTRARARGREVGLPRLRALSASHPDTDAFNASAAVRADTVMAAWPDRDMTVSVRASFASMSPADTSVWSRGEATSADDGMWPEIAALEIAPIAIDLPSGEREPARGLRPIEIPPVVLPSTDVAPLTVPPSR